MMEAARTILTLARLVEPARRLKFILFVTLSSAVLLPMIWWESRHDEA